VKQKKNEEAIREKGRDRWQRWPKTRFLILQGGKEKYGNRTENYGILGTDNPSYLPNG